jgi:hypothetical protein
MLIEDHECWLVDDGSLDTVISIDNKEFRFSQERAASCRDENGSMTDSGFEELCMEIIKGDLLVNDIEIIYNSLINGQTN